MESAEVISHIRGTEMLKFTYKEPDGDRIHYITEDDVKVLLSRLPHETWRQVRIVHFNDHGYELWRRDYGYVTGGRREIAICALPPRISLNMVCIRFELKPEEFGGYRNRFWTRIAIRRFMLYHVFLHELGHLQIIKPKSRSRLRFAGEKLAEEFANRWRRELWKAPFDHPDPIHNPPGREELARLTVVRRTA